MEKQPPRKQFKFSWFFFCPDCFKPKAYSKALNNFYEYLDIKNIIKRLQDVDKLKFLLLDHQQRKAFELLPKPGIAGESKLKKQTTFLLESVLSLKPKNFKNEKITDFAFLMNGETITKRMLDLMDPSIGLELQDIENKKKILFSKEEKTSNTPTLFVGEMEEEG